MWNLEYELIAILMLAAIIGLLMGRFLCKSGETEERLEKKRVITAFKSTQFDLQKSEDKVTEQASMVTKQKESISQLEEDIVNLNMRLHSSETQRATLLENLKELEKYKSRFEALSKEFQVQSKMVETLKGVKSTKIEEVEGLKTAVKVLQQNKQELEGKESKLKEELDVTLDSSRNQTQKIKELHQLNENSMKAINEMSDQREELSQKLEQSLAELESLHEHLRVKEKAYSELGKQYSEYKNGINIDSERLAFLEKEYEELGQNFNTVLVERDDLLSRIRAISSVVGAVGIDNDI
ncbi:MAG: hypothetical protein K0U38_11000 [Epsilonproteobacteria bacterium]|nr:hypothetical protein [Campylobacterota bacterium]